MSSYELHNIFDGRQLYFYSNLKEMAKMQKRKRRKEKEKGSRKGRGNKRRRKKEER
jgi:hypothetical protein